MLKVTMNDFTEFSHIGRVKTEGKVQYIYYQVEDDDLFNSFEKAYAQNVPVERCMLFLPKVEGVVEATVIIPQRIIAGNYGVYAKAYGTDKNPEYTFGRITVDTNLIEATTWEIFAIPKRQFIPSINTYNTRVSKNGQVEAVMADYTFENFDFILESHNLKDGQIVKVNSLEPNQGAFDLDYEVKVNYPIPLAGVDSWTDWCGNSWDKVYPLAALLSREFVYVLWQDAQRRPRLWTLRENLTQMSENMIAVCQRGDSKPLDDVQNVLQTVEAPLNELMRIVPFHSLSKLAAGL